MTHHSPWPQAVIDYYKWVVTVASFVLTVSFGIVKLLPSNQGHAAFPAASVFFFSGWLFLFGAILNSCWKVWLFTFFDTPLSPPKAKWTKIFLIKEIDIENLKFTWRGLIIDMVFWLGLIFVFAGILLSVF